MSLNIFRFLVWQINESFMNNLSYDALETWEVIESLFILEKLSVLKECRMKIYNDEFLSWSSLLLINQPSSCVKMSYWLSLGLISTACLMVLYPVFERGGGKGRRSELVQAWTYVWSMYELQWSSKVMDGKDWEPVRPFGKISGKDSKQNLYKVLFISSCTRCFNLIVCWWIA